MFLVAGLGNPGAEYRNTRHNVGFQVLRLWAKSHGIIMKSRRFHSRSGQLSLGEQKVILLCPETFMNRSGLALKACADFYRLEPGDVLAVHDDLDLPVGRIRVARRGGGGGHKGIQSIIDHLGTREFSRVKIGIGRPRHLEPVEEFVLRPFYNDQQEVVQRVLSLAVKACEWFVLEGVEKAMEAVNGQNLGPGEVTP
ncbi:MAG: aminoacyl-tRNA hydrolase [Thermodesulfobacteriota bacterium]